MEQRRRTAALRVNSNEQVKTVVSRKGSSSFSAFTTPFLSEFVGGGALHHPYFLSVKAKTTRERYKNGIDSMAKTRYSQSAIPIGEGEKRQSRRYKVLSPAPL